MYILQISNINIGRTFFNSKQSKSNHIGILQVK